MATQLESLEKIKDKFGLVEQRADLFAIIYYDEKKLLVHVATDGESVQEYSHSFNKKPSVSEFKGEVEKILTSVNI